MPYFKDLFYAPNDGMNKKVRAAGGPFNYYYK